MNPIFLFFLLLGILGMTGNPLSSQTPVEDFFRSSEFDSFVISPDGRTLAVIGAWEGRKNLFVYDVDSGESRRLTGFTKHDVVGMFWATNDRIIYYLAEVEGYESFGIFAINRDGRLPRTLVRPLTARGGVYVARRTVVLDRLKNDPDFILVMNNDRDLDYPDVFRMHIVREGSTRPVLRNPGNVVQWMTDQNGVVRLGVTSDRENNRTGVVYRRTEKDNWQTLDQFDSFGRGWRPVAFDFDEERLFIASSERTGFEGLYVYDLKTREITQRVLTRNGFDVGNLILSEHFRVPLGASYHTTKPGIVWFDEEKRQLQTFLDNMFPETVNRITSRNDEETRMVVTSWSDRTPPFFHLLRMDGGQVSVLPLGHSRPWLDGVPMAPMRPVEFTSRDGKLIHGYLTMPLHHSEGKPAPMIIHPHGGPWARDFWGFNPEIQFLASRGYAVFQINFRGSTGFGVDFLRAGDKAWGREMQFDIYDGVQWAIEQGYADPDRIGIYGASYGGYTTMMQLVMFPDLYRFGINYVGVVELRELIMHRRREQEVLNFYSRTIGDPEEERDLLREFSPLYMIDRLQAPLMIVHGGVDPRVPLEQANMLRRALDRRGFAYEWIVRMDEGHGFRQEKNNFELYRAMESFLNRVMPADAPPASVAGN